KQDEKLAPGSWISRTSLPVRTSQSLGRVSRPQKLAASKFPSGWKATCPAVYGHMNRSSPVLTSHTRTERSPAQQAQVLRFGLKARRVTECTCPRNVRPACLVATSKSLMARL